MWGIVKKYQNYTSKFICAGNLSFNCSSRTALPQLWPDLGNILFASQEGTIQLAMHCRQHLPNWLCKSYFRKFLLSIVTCSGLSIQHFREEQIQGGLLLQRGHLQLHRVRGYLHPIQLRTAPPYLEQVKQILVSYRSREVTWPQYWAVIGRDRSSDQLDPVRTDHVTWFVILALIWQNKSNWLID